MIRFLTALLAAIAATPINPKSCEDKYDPRDGKVLGTLSESLQRFWSYMNVKDVELRKVVKDHDAEHKKPGYMDEKCKEVHARVEKLNAERFLLSAIFWEAVRDEVAGAREADTIGVRQDFTVVEVKAASDVPNEILELAELLGSTLGR